MSIIRLKPYCTDYIWGGNRLRTEFNIESDLDKVSEAWVLSCHGNGASLVDSGTYKGKTLEEYIKINGKEILGTNMEDYDEFPILTKLIDAKENLSIQVHPDNSYAKENEGSYGKSEMWYVIDAKPGAIIYCGVNRAVSTEEMARRIEDCTLTDVLNAVPVKAGDSFYIPAGTLHAICEGVIIAEIQQNSNITYRVFDYGRKDVNGNTRELHVQKALEVARKTPNYSKDFNDGHLVKCPFFTADILDGTTTDIVTDLSFVSLVVISGSGTIKTSDEEISINKGESFFISAGIGEYQITDSGNDLKILKAQIGRV